MDGTPHQESAVWLDHVTCRGPGQGLELYWDTWAPGFNRKYFTDMSFSDHRSSIDWCELARNVTVERVRQGARGKLVVNCTIDDIGPAGTDDHPDVFSWNFSNNVFDNHIVYGFAATRCNAYMLIASNPGVRNFALVNVAIKGETVAPSIVGSDTLDHFLVLNCTWRQSWLWRLPQASMGNVSVRGSYFANMGLDGPADGVRDSWFDQNCIGQGWRPFAPGTNTTTSDPQFVGDFTPGPDSPLRHRLGSLLVPIDKGGVQRTVPATIGAVE